LAEGDKTSLGFELEISGDVRRVGAVLAPTALPLLTVIFAGSSDHRRAQRFETAIEHGR
jgi:hypothetical protein